MGLFGKPRRASAPANGAGMYLPPSTAASNASTINKFAEGADARHTNGTATRAADGRGTADNPWRIGPCDISSFKLLDVNKEPETAIPKAVRNKEHNRHLDCLPNPLTRVRLKADTRDPTAEYYNANFVRGSNLAPRKYVCAMGPLPANVGHFWRLVWEHDVQTIVMVTGLEEKGKSKCEPYWPPNQHAPKLKAGGLTVRTGQVLSAAGCTHTQLTVKHGRTARTVNHFWFSTWPDHGVPKTADGNPDPTDIISMLREVHQHRAEVAASGPILVHCSAGIGRSGTVIAIDWAMEQLSRSGQCDPLDVVQMIRQDRMALVQHPNQFQLLHAACFIAAKMEGAVARLDSEMGSASRPLPASASASALVSAAAPLETYEDMSNTVFSPTPTAAEPEMYEDMGAAAGVSNPAAVGYGRSSSDSGLSRQGSGPGGRQDEALALLDTYTSMMVEEGGDMYTAMDNDSPPPALPTRGRTDRAPAPAPQALAAAEEATESDEETPPPLPDKESARSPVAAGGDLYDAMDAPVVVAQASSLYNVPRATPAIPVPGPGKPDVFGRLIGAATPPRPAAPNPGPAAGSPLLGGHRARSLVNLASPGRDEEETETEGEEEGGGPAPGEDIYSAMDAPHVPETDFYGAFGAGGVQAPVSLAGPASYGPVSRQGAGAAPASYGPISRQGAGAAPAAYGPVTHGRGQVAAAPSAMETYGPAPAARVVVGADEDDGIYGPAVDAIPATAGIEQPRPGEDMYTAMEAPLPRSHATAGPEVMVAGEELYDAMDAPPVVVSDGDDLYAHQEGLAGLVYGDDDPPPAQQNGAHPTLPAGRSPALPTRAPAAIPTPAADPLPPRVSPKLPARAPPAPNAVPAPGGAGRTTPSPPPIPVAGSYYEYGNLGRSQPGTSVAAKIAALSSPPPLPAHRSPSPAPKKLPRARPERPESEDFGFGDQPRSPEPAKQPPNDDEIEFCYGFGFDEEFSFDVAA